MPETWGRVQTKELPFTQEQLLEDIAKEKKKGISAVAIYQDNDMNGSKRTQVDRLIENMTLGDQGYEYKLVSLKLNYGKNPRGQRITDSMRIILKRQLAPNLSGTGVRDLDSQHINDHPHHQGYFPTAPPINHSGPQPMGYDQAGRSSAERHGVLGSSPRPIPHTGPTFQHEQFPLQPDGWTPESTPSSDGFALSPDFFQPRPAHPMDQERDGRFSELHGEQKQHGHGPTPRPNEQGDRHEWAEFFQSGPPPEQVKKPKKKEDKPSAGDHHDRPEFSHGGPTAEQVESPKKKDNKPPAGDHGSKKHPGKKDNKNRRPSSERFESDYSDGVSDYSGWTNQTADTEYSDPVREQRDGYRSSYGTRDGDYDDYDRGKRHDPASRRRGSHRSSRDSYENENDLGSIRQHRRKSPPRSSNSSTSSGSRYAYDEKVYIPSNSRRTRRGSDHSPDYRPTFHTRDNSYDETRSLRRPGMYAGKRRSGLSPAVELYDERDDKIQETVRAHVKQELEKKKMEELKKENKRLKEEQQRYRPDLMSERERFSRGSGYPTTNTGLPRSRRFEADLQGNYHPYGL